MDATAEWGCPCRKVVCNLTGTGTRVYQASDGKKTIYLCEAVVDECDPDKPTRVEVMSATLIKVEVKSSITGAWVKSEAADEGHYWYEERLLHHTRVDAEETLQELHDLVGNNAHIDIKLPEAPAGGEYELQRQKRLAEMQAFMGDMFEQEFF